MSPQSGAEEVPLVALKNWQKDLEKCRKRSISTIMISLVRYLALF
jgi:hypothetical protein